jgi:hypothetical protein
MPSLSPQDNMCFRSEASQHVVSVIDLTSMDTMNYKTFDL